MRVVRSIGVVGAGTMGRGIAELAARAGFTVMLHDAAEGAASRALATIGETLKRDVEKGRLQPGEAEGIVNGIAAAPLEAVAAADLVIEAIVEKLEIKQALFRDIERLAPATTILATNTSSLSVAAIADGIADPARLAGFHFFNPPTRMRIVEIVRGPKTSEQAIAILRAVSEKLGQRVFLVPDTPGFLVNHIGRAFTGEALRMLDEGIASPHTLDRIAKGALHFRMGPFELLDLTGIDVSAEVTEQIWKGFGEEPRFRLAPIARRRVEAGLFGRKTGKGFYTYGKDGKAVAEPEREESARPVKVRLAGIPDDLRDSVCALFRSEFLTEDLSAPTVVCPIGTSVAVKADRLDLDPVETVGIDPLFTDLVTLAGTSHTRPGLIESVAATLRASGREVAIVKDGPGMPAQRIAAMMVLIASDAAARGIATPQDIDAAARLALAYPQGPLELGDAVGPARIAAIATGLFALTGDPRWRPSPRLSERAARGRKLADSLPERTVAPN
jgi:3-hydroxybutyryl-CoA dehydrogenase